MTKILDFQQHNFHHALCRGGHIEFHFYNKASNDNTHQETIIRLRRVAG